MVIVVIVVLVALVRSFLFFFSSSVLRGAKSRVTLITNAPACVQMNARSDHVLITPQRTIRIQIIANSEYISYKCKKMGMD